jgi:hypothetical protein
MFILYSRSYHIHIAQVLHRRIDQVREFLGEQDAATKRLGQGFQPNIDRDRHFLLQGHDTCEVQFKTGFIPGTEPAY